MLSFAFKTCEVKPGTAEVAPLTILDGYCAKPGFEKIITIPRIDFTSFDSFDFIIFKFPDDGQGAKHI